MRVKTLIGILIFASLIINIPNVGVEPSTSWLHPELPSTMDRGKSSAYTPHAPIVITNDTDFSTQGWSGSGTEEIPYVIENLSIESDSYCIAIYNTSANFEIRDCYLRSISGDMGTGIYFDNVTQGAVLYCDISYLDYGIQADYSYNCSVFQNSISYCKGIVLFHSQDIFIDSNTFSNQGNSFFGFYMDRINFTNNIMVENITVPISGLDLDYSLIYNNTMKATGSTCIGLEESDLTRIELNNISGGSYGIKTEYCGWINITKNIINNSNGIYFYHQFMPRMDGNTILNSGSRPITINFPDEIQFYKFLSFTNNTWNGNDIYLIQDEYDFVLSADMGLVIVIDSQLVTISNQHDGYIDCYYSTLIEISDCTFNTGGIRIEESENVTISHLQMNGGSGIYLRICWYVDIIENIILNTDSGISYYGGYYVTVKNNTIRNCTNGISTFYGGWLNITKNLIDSCETGIDLGNEFSTSIVGNRVSNSTNRCIRLYSSDEATVYLNSFDGFAEGVFLDDPEEPSVWDNGTVGNYWSDYAGIDANSDGIGDQPYIIDTSNQDNYPLMSDDLVLEYLGRPSNGDEPTTTQMTNPTTTPSVSQTSSTIATSGSTPTSSESSVSISIITSTSASTSSSSVSTSRSTSTSTKPSSNTAQTNPIDTFSVILIAGGAVLVIVIIVIMKKRT